MLEFCGRNDHLQFGEESNNKSANGKTSVISPPVRSSIDATTISSFSVYEKHAVMVTKGGEVFAAGYNGSGQIIGSLPKDLRKFTKFSIKDGHFTLHPISAVCGLDFTLYIVSKSKTSDDRRLAYSYNGIKTADPLFLNIGDSNPVSLFGGYCTAAVIDSDGSIIFIPESAEVEKLASSFFERARLPDSEAASIIAFCDESVFAVGSSGRVFESKIPKERNKLNFVPVESLEKEKICEISGTYYHCFAVTEDGRVFGHGWNECCQLGFKKEIDEVSEFVEISSLKDYKIKHAYAGRNHSLFQTEEGKILACGMNSYGELLMKNPSKDSFCLTDSGVSDAKFCVTGNSVTAVFIGCDPLKSPNRLKIPETTESKVCTPSLLSSSNVSILEAENERLRKENESLRKMIKEQQDVSSLLNELKKSKEMNEELQNEKSQLLKKINKSKQFQTFEILDDETIENFEKIEEIGFGSSGKVFKVSKKKFYAMKEMHMNDLNTEKIQQFLKEYEIMNLLQHPNIIKTFGILINSSKHNPCILLEYCSTNLQKVIEQKIFSNEQIVTSIYQIAEAMKYIHFKKIIHRDLKPTNILVEKDGIIKITDFGSSKLMTLEEQTMSQGIGTQKYMAQEIINEEENYTEKVDVYSFGVVVFFILSGGEVPKIKIGDILKGKKAPLPEKFTDFAKKLIYDCWNFESKDRPSFKEIVDQIESNHYKLLKLSKLEVKNVEIFVTNHKTKIPPYDV